MSLSDPLTLLREHTLAKKPIVLEGEHIVFGKLRFARNAPTAYKASGGGKRYAIDSAWSLLQGKTGAEYAKFVAEQNIEAVAFKDRKTLLAYLEGKGDGGGNIDFSGIGEVRPVDAGSTSAGAKDVNDSSAAAGRKAQAGKPTAAPTEADLKAVEVGKAAFLTFLDQPSGVLPATAASFVKEHGISVPAEEEAAAAAAGDGEDADGADGAKSSGSTAAFKQMNGLAKPFIRHDRETSAKIVARQWELHDRSSALLAPSTKSFPVLENVFDGYRKRNKMESERKDREAKKAASGKPPSSAAGAPAGGAAPSAAVAPPRSSTGPSSSAAAGAGKPIIVVPGAITAIVNMFNARMLLEDSSFEPAADLKAKGAVKEPMLTVRHTFEDGMYADFLVVDNPTTRLSPADWSNLAGVVAAGTTWQFKGWPFAKGEAELFAKCCGFAVRFTDEIPNQLTKGWAVTHLVFSKERTRRHEVGVAMTTFWEKIHKFLLRQKPHLLHKAK